MDRKDKVLELVGRLSASEKRYISVHAPEDKKYIKLYRDLLKTSAHDQDKLEDKYGDNLPAYYFQLFNFILRCLRDYRRKKSVQIQIADYLADAQILLEMDLIDQCVERANLAKGLAAEHNDYLSLQKAIKIIRYCYIKSKRLRDEISYQEITALKTANLHALQKEIEMEDLYHDIYQYTHLVLNGEKLEDLTKKIPPETFDLANAPSGERAKRRFLEAATLYFKATKDLEKLAQYASLVKDWWDDHPTYKKSEAHIYLLSLSNVISFLHHADRKEGLIELYDQLSELETENEHTRGIALVKSAIGRLLLFMNEGQMEKAKSIVAEVKQDPRFKKIPFPSRFSLYYNIATLYFLLEEFDECAQWTKKIIKLIPSNTRQDVQIAALYLQLISELQNDKGLRLAKGKTYRTARKFFEQDLKLGEDTIPQKIVFGLAAVDDLPVLDRKPHYRQLLQEIQSPQLDAGGEATGIHEVRLWCISQTKGISILQALKRK